MTYVVCEPCVNCRYTDCVVVCPVEAFHLDDTAVWINPETCIDCDACVEACPVNAIYPEDDLGPAQERFTLFLVQYWGGPTTYTDQRGHPRLRMRHAPFAVTPRAKEHWLTHFRAALDEAALPPELDAQFWDYVTHAAQFMVNTFEEPAPVS